MSLLLKHTLFDEFQLRGTFWTPTKPENKVPGKFFWSPKDGGRLELLGQILLSRDDRWDVLLFGEVANDAIGPLPVTLENVTRRRDGGRDDHSLFSATRCYCGAHVKLDQHLFSSTDIYLDSLAEWYGFEPWEMRGQLEQPEGEGRRKITLLDTPHIVIPVPSIGGDIQFTGIRRSSYTRKSFSITHDVLLVAQCKPRPIEDWWDFVHSQTRLITLLSCGRCHPNRVELELRRSQAERHRLGEKVCVYFRHNRERQDYQQIGPNMPFQYPRIKEVFARVADKWFSAYDKLHDCLRILFRQLERPGDEIIPRFLNACQMFEAFHRITRDEPYADPVRYSAWFKQMKSAIPVDVSEPHRNSLENKLKYGNERALRSRLRAAFESLPPEVRVAIDVDPKKDANLIADTRNAHIHLNESPDKKTLTEREMVPYCSKIVMTVGYLLWCDLGLKEFVRVPRDVNELWFLT
ncbi:MAG: hypothetical protein HPKKFMNG_01122 [Planctomycetes bacterium]|nr:hypothetical protein [Planctomycetota bacterium]